MGLKIYTQPVAELLTVAECKAHLRVDTDDEDTLIMALQQAAREWCEKFTGISMAVKTYELALDAFPASGEIELPMPPLVEVTRVAYDDAALAEQVIDSADYATDAYQSPAWLLPAYGESWPATADTMNAVRIRYRAGYAVPGDESGPEELPATYRAAILLMLAHLFDNRTATVERALSEIPLGIESLLRPHRVLLGMA